MDLGYYMRFRQTVLCQGWELAKPCVLQRGGGPCQEEAAPFANSQHDAVQRLLYTVDGFSQTPALCPPRRCPDPSPLTLAVSLIDEEFIPLLAAAFKAAHCVAANVVTTSIV